MLTWVYQNWVFCVFVRLFDTQILDFRKMKKKHPKKKVTVLIFSDKELLFLLLRWISLLWSCWMAACTCCWIWALGLSRLRPPKQRWMMGSGIMSTSRGMDAQVSEARCMGYTVYWTTNTKNLFWSNVKFKYQNRKEFVTPVVCQWGNLYNERQNQ